MLGSLKYTTRYYHKLIIFLLKSMLHLMAYMPFIDPELFLLFTRKFTTKPYLHTQVVLHAFCIVYMSYVK